jgi:hypothetical protein
VTQRYCNHSAFNGYRWTASEYSGIRCMSCRTPWRTKAKYVEQLRDARWDPAKGDWVDFP